MSTIPAKQIIRPLAAFVRVGSFAATGSSGNATAAITAALNSAGDGGVSVPLQPASSTAIGIFVLPPFNRVEVWEASTGSKILANGNEVYGRLTESSGTYTLSYFSLVSGTETAYSFPASQSISFEFAYRFDFARLPATAILAARSGSSAATPAGPAVPQSFRERLTIASQNTVPALARSPVDAASVALIINGVSYDTFGGAAAAFSVNLGTRAITWSAANSGFNLDVSDRVIAEYNSLV